MAGGQRGCCSWHEVCGTFRQATSGEGCAGQVYERHVDVRSVELVHRSTCESAVSIAVAIAGEC